MHYFCLSLIIIIIIIISLVFWFSTHRTKSANSSWNIPSCISSVSTLQPNSSGRWYRWNVQSILPVSMNLIQPLRLSRITTSPNFLTDKIIRARFYWAPVRGTTRRHMCKTSTAVLSPLHCNLDAWTSMLWRQEHIWDIVRIDLTSRSTKLWKSAEAAACTSAMDKLHHQPVILRTYTLP